MIPPDQIKRRRGSVFTVPTLAAGLARDRALAGQRGVLALIAIRARIRLHGIPTGIVGGCFRGSVHGSKLLLLILDLVLQFLDALSVRLGTALGRSFSPRLLLAIRTSLADSGLLVLGKSTPLVHGVPTVFTLAPATATAVVDGQGSDPELRVRGLRILLDEVLEKGDAASKIRSKTFVRADAGFHRI